VHPGRTVGRNGRERHAGMEGMMGGRGEVNMAGPGRGRQASGDDGPGSALTWMARHSEATGRARQLAFMANVTTRSHYYSSDGPKKNKLASPFSRFNFTTFFADQSQMQAG
jgi:hypothetical protein